MLCEKNTDRYEIIKAQWRAANKRYYDKVKHDAEFKRKRSEYHRRRYQARKEARLLAEREAARVQAVIKLGVAVFVVHHEQTSVGLLEHLNVVF